MGRVACDNETDNDAAGLMVRWHRLVGSGAEADSVGSVLIERWDEPHRVYHATTHLAAVLDRLDDLEGDGVEVTRAVRLAAWFHDAVYDPRGTDNEDRSAALATALLPAAGVEVTTVKEVVRLVRLTAGHRPGPRDAAGAALCDADLAVLAGCPPDYLAYAAAVRREYRHVPEPAFRQGRSDLLVDMLGRAELYATAAGRRRWEAAARANLAAELARLEAAGR
jgi:predicted metal-dependent HD superfamily phosphohydrolase